MKIALFLAGLYSVSVYASETNLPKEDEIPQLCSQASQAIPNETGKYWTESALGQLNDGDLAKTILLPESRPPLEYRPFQLYNATSVRTSEYLTRYILAQSELYYAKKFVSPSPVQMVHLDPVIESLKATFAQALVEPDKISLMSESEILNTAAVSREYDPYEKNLPRLCSYAELLLPQCDLTFSALLNFARPYASNGGTLYAAFLAYVHFRSSPEFIRGLSYYSLHALERFRSEIKQVRTEPSDILSDLEDGFRATGMGDGEARDAAHLVLLTYSIRGASYLAGHSDLDFPGLTLTTVMSFISHFDHVQRSRHEPSYFLPRQIKINCFYGKPYHFWMAASLAYFTRRSGYPERTSAFAAYTLGVAYDVLMVANGRDYKKLLNLPRFHADVNQERSDLFFKQLGAVYGASIAGGIHTADYTHLYYEMYHESGQTPEWLIMEMKKKMPANKNTEKFPEWFNLVQPYSTFSRVMGKMR